MNKRYPIVFLLMLLWCTTTTMSQTASSTTGGTESIVGIVRDSLGQPIAGATLRLVGTNGGTVSSPKGEFRVHTTMSSSQVRVTSLGYETVVVQLRTDTLNTIILQPQPLVLANVVVTDEISPEEIIRRAIDRKREHQQGLKSVSKHVYSKMHIELASSMPYTKPTAPTTMIVETIARVNEQFMPSYLKNTILLHRRQTANVPPQANIQSVSELFSLMDDELRIGSTRLTTPLARTALQTYRYTLRGKTSYNGVLVYTIDFSPLQQWMPALEGTLHITERGFALVGAEFSPTSSTSLPAVTKLRYKQRYEAFGDTARPAWIPTLTEASFQATANLLVMRASASFSLQSIVSDVTVNQTLPPSALKPAQVVALPKLQRSTTKLLGRDTATVRSARLNDSTFLTIAEGVDSANEATWQALMLRERTAQELAAYRTADSTVQARLRAGKRSPVQVFDSTLAVLENATASAAQSQRQIQSLFTFPVGAFTMGFEPVIITPRTASTLVGVDAAVQWNGTTLRTQAITNLDQWFGSAELSQTLASWSNGFVELTGRAFSQISSVQARRAESPAFTGIQLQTDYRWFEQHHDFFREHGASAGIRITTESATQGMFTAALTARWSRQYSMNTLERLENARPNMAIEDGTFTTVRADIRWDSEPLSTFQELPFEPATTFVSARLRAAFGGRSTPQEPLAVQQAYHLAEGSVAFVQPTVPTGYTPMHFTVLSRAGVSSAAAPVQERFLLMRRFAVAGSMADFLSPSIGAFGGTRYVSVRVEHNFSDLLWRVVGLPTYKGRGLDVIAHAGIARYEHEFAGVAPSLFPPTNGWYSEAGSGIGRIPLVIVDFVTLRFDAAWRLGAQEPPGTAARGNFGWSLGFALSL